MFTRNNTAAVKPLERSRVTTIPLAGALPGSRPRLAATEPPPSMQPAPIHSAFASETTASGAASSAFASSPHAGTPAVLPATEFPSSETQPKSVISSDLVISGQQLRITARSLLQVDGAIEGDVHGTEIIIGVSGRVTGTVAAESVIVEGQVDGTIRGVRVMLRSTSRVEGDIHHQSLAMDRGAQFDGRVRRAQDARELLPDLEPMPAAPRGAREAA